MKGLTSSNHELMQTPRVQWGCREISFYTHLLPEWFFSFPHSTSQLSKTFLVFTCAVAMSCAGQCALKHLFAGLWEAAWQTRHPEKRTLYHKQNETGFFRRRSRASFSSLIAPWSAHQSKPRYFLPTQGTAYSYNNTSQLLLFPIIVCHPSPFQTSCVTANL